MKILIENNTNIIKYAEYDIIQFANMSLSLNNTNTVIFTISDMTSENSTLITINQDNLPTDFVGNKYKYINDGFVLNEEYTYTENDKTYNYLGEEI